MGYSTDFSGSFSVSPALGSDMIAFLEAFSETRRMCRNASMIKDIYPDWEDNCFFGELGEEGAYFVGGGGFAGQDHDDSIIDYNDPPQGQPGLWCQWIPSDDGTEIMWDGGEKFYHYTEWLEYIIDNFLAPNGYALNGEVYWYGEESDDIGKIIVSDNQVDVKYGRVTYDYD